MGLLDILRPKPDVRNSPAGKIHDWRPPFRKMSTGDPFTAKDMQPLYDAEAKAVAHRHRFKSRRVFAWRGRETLMACDCGIVYGKTAAGWRTIYSTSLAVEGLLK